MCDTFWLSKLVGDANVIWWWKSRMSLNILQCIGWLPQQRGVQSQCQPPTAEEPGLPACVFLGSELWRTTGWMCLWDSDHCWAMNWFLQTCFLLLRGCLISSLAYMDPCQFCEDLCPLATLLLLKTQLELVCLLTIKSITGLSSP